MERRPVRPGTTSRWPPAARILLPGLVALFLPAGSHPARGADAPGWPALWAQTGEGSSAETPDKEKPTGAETEPAETEPEADTDESEEGPTGVAAISPLRVRWDAGLHLEGKWEHLHIKIAGDLQNDTAGFVNTESAEELLGTEIAPGVEWRRARLYAEGRLWRHLDFKLRYDFTAGNPPNLKDAFFSFVNLPIPTAGLTMGRFRAPLGLDGYTGADDIVFMERSTMSEAFLPSRNTGFMLHGDSPNQRLRWHVAVLQPEASDIDLSNTDDLGWSARLAWAFTRGEGGRTLFHLGANFWRRNVSQTILYASRPESHIAPFFVDTGDIPAETSDTTVFESAVQAARWTFEGEFALAKVSKTGLDSAYFYGFYVQGSRFLTGEKRPYRTDRGTFTRPHPKRSIRDRGKGAMEVAFRFSRIDLTDKAFDGGILNDWSAGFNWYPTYHTKVMINAILADLEGAKPVGIFQMRLQVAF